VVRELIIAVAMQESGWSAAHAGVLEDGVRQMSKNVNLQDQILAVLTELASNPSSAVRGEVVRLLHSLVRRICVWAG